MSRNTRYTVTGIHAVHGHKPGETFSADLPEEQERVLLGGGAIVRAVEVEKAGEKSDEKADDKRAGGDKRQ